MMDRFPTAKRLFFSVVIVLLAIQIAVPSFCLESDEPRVFSFGSNAAGQLGDNSNTNRNFPDAVNTSGVLDGKTITAFAGGQSHAIFLSSTGQVFSVGYNGNGQLGDGTNKDKWLPVAVNTSDVLDGKNIVVIAAGWYHNLVLASTGEMFSFGFNNHGQLGDGTIKDKWLPVTVNTSGILNGENITAIAAGGFHSLVLLTSGQVFSIGDNNYGQLGDNTNTYRSTPVAIDISGVLNGIEIIAIACGLHHSLVLSSDGQVFGFGANSNGQLGDGTQSQRNVPVALNTSGVLNGKTIAAIAGGQSHSLVLSSSGQVFSVGWNLYGTLGDGTNTDRHTPVAVNTSGVLNGKTIIAISAGGDHSLVLSSTGQVFTFGRDDYGQLGDGSNTNRNIPVAMNTSNISNVKKFTAISCGQDFSLVLGTSSDFPSDTSSDVDNSSELPSNGASSQLENSSPNSSASNLGNGIPIAMIALVICVLLLV